MPRNTDQAPDTPQQPHLQSTLEETLVEVAVQTARLQAQPEETDRSSPV
ncbi:hypothetical protein ACIOJD_33790 [Streptomyces sp. NPDC088116]